MKVNARTIKRRFFVGSTLIGSVTALLGRSSQKAHSDAVAQDGLLWAVTFDGQIDSLGEAASLDEIGSLGTADADGAGVPVEIYPVEIYADQAAAQQAALALAGSVVAVTDDAGRPAAVAVRPIAWRFIGPPMAAHSRPQGNQALKPGSASR